eukprot:gene4745-5922_t
MSSLESDQVRLKVVIIGGGYAGSNLAKLLDSKPFDVTLIERKKTFFHSVAGPRLSVQPELVPKCFISYDKLMKNGKIIFRNVTEITPQKVVLDNNDEVPFDYLVIATGTNNLPPAKSPLNVDDAPNYYNNIKSKIEQSKKVLIIGGGAVGTELAGEIATEFPDKSITLVHSGSKLINDRMNDKFQKKLREKLKNFKVNVILDDKIENIPDQVKNDLINQSPVEYQVENRTYTTSKGVQVEADLVFWCVGAKVNNETFRNHFQTAINEEGRLIVNKHLQVEGFRNIFAIGDINNVDELKTAYNAKFHSEVVAKNLGLFLKKGEDVKLEFEHKPSKPIMALALGEKDGVTQMPNGWILGGIITSKVKSKGLFISNFQKDFNSPKPYFNQ